MFTGLVETTSNLINLSSYKLVVEKPVEWKIQLGESISVDGCCLTVVSFDHQSMVFEVSEETLSRTHFGSLPTGYKFNLERALKSDDRLGGHWVQGHVDTVGEIVRITKTDVWHEYVVSLSKQFEELVIPKGSIAIQGTSLTINTIEDLTNSFHVSVMIIPHTFHITNLSQLKVQDKVNIEFDLLGKYVHRILSLQSR